MEFNPSMPKLITLA